MNRLASLLADQWRGQIKADEATRASYSRDASIFEIDPAVIAYPQDLNELKALVNWTRTQREAAVSVSLTPRGAGTGMTGGSLNEDIIVDLQPYFQLVGQPTPEGLLEVEAGAPFRQIAAVADDQGLMFAPYPSSWEVCTIGGMLGNNASGEKSLRFGATSDNVESVRVCLADGQDYWFGPLNPDQLAAKCQQTNFEGYIYQTIRGLIEANTDLLDRNRPRVRKNAAGYDLWRVWDHSQQYFNLAPLLIGSQGTLGIITAAKLHLAAKPRHQQLIVIGVDNLSQLSGVLTTILHHSPECVELYDHQTHQLAQKEMPEQARATEAVADHQLILLAQFAEVNQVRTEAVAKLVGGELAKQGLDVRFITDPAEAAAHWQIRRASFKLLQDHGGDQLRACPFLEDTIVSPTHFGPFLEALEAILSDYHLTYTYHGHIGEGNLRLIPLIDLTHPEAIHLITELARRVYDLVIAFDGSISVDHNDGLAKSPYLTTLYGEPLVDLFRQIKQTFDPLGIFNPHKKTTANLDYSLAHISRQNQQAQPAEAAKVTTAAETTETSEEVKIEDPEVELMPEFISAGETSPQEPLVVSPAKPEDSGTGDDELGT